MAHGATNIINSSDSLWLLLVQSNAGGVRIRTQHSQGNLHQDRAFASGETGSFFLFPQTVYSLETQANGPCDLRFHLLDRHATRPRGGYLAYSVPESAAGQACPEPVLEYRCLPTEWPHVLPALRHPSRRLLDIHGEGWRWQRLDALPAGQQQHDRDPGQDQGQVP